MSGTLAGALAARAATPAGKTVRDLIAAHRPDIDRLLPAGTSADEFERVALRELYRTPLLGECDPWSYLGAVMQATRLGLIPDEHGLVYLVPFKREVQVVVGYRGLVELAYRSGVVKSLVADLVYEGDTFRVVKGTSPKVEHEALGPPDDREVIAAYAVAKLATGGTVSRVIYSSEWDGKGTGAAGKLWTADPVAMIQKAALVRLATWLPQTRQLAAAVLVDERPAERLDSMITGDALSVPARVDDGGQG